MADITKKFDDFKAKKVKDFAKNKEFQPLSDDIIAIKELEDGSIEKIKGRNLFMVLKFIISSIQTDPLKNDTGSPQIRGEKIFNPDSRWLECNMCRYCWGDCGGFITNKCRMNE